MSLTIEYEQSPFDYDFFTKLAHYLGRRDISCLRLVDREYNDWVKATNSIWRRFSQQEGIPCVARANPQSGDARMDYITLRPCMISKAFYDQYLGVMTEPVPPISENDFNRLMKVNPFDEEKRRVCETFKVLVDPTLLRRTENVAVLEPLLEISSLDTQGALLIPLTLKNLKVLWDHPLQAADNSPVFRLFDDLVLDQCNDWPDRISVSFISECVAEETRGEDYDTQRKLLRERGFRVASLRHCIYKYCSTAHDGHLC